VINMTIKKKHLKVVLLDGYCASHVGNDVLLESSYQQVKKMYPNAEIKVHAKEKDSFLESQGYMSGKRLFSSPPAGIIRKYLWFINELIFMFVQILNANSLKINPSLFAFGDRKRTIKDYLECDVAVTIGGEMISGTFWKVLPLHLHMYWLAQHCGAKVVVFPQSIGPFKKDWTRKLAKLVLSKCNVVTGRDELSMEELRSLGLTSSNVLFSPDVGVGQPMSSKEDATVFLESLGVDLGKRCWIGVTCSAGSPESGIQRIDHISTLVDALTLVGSEREIGVVLIPANMPVKGEKPTDYNASSELHERLLAEGIHSIICPVQVMPARLFKAVSGLLNVFVSTRMHAAILSTMAPVPTITLNTQRKLLGYMTLVGQEAYSLNLQGLNSKNLADKIKEASDNAANIRHSLLAARAQRVAALDEYGNRVKLILSLQDVY
jgi:colanic acid/amylovoran biosynthesis protein